MHIQPIQPSSQDDFTFMTYNINYSGRAVKEYAQYSWENRKDDVYNLIQGANPTIIFLQEIQTKNQEEVSTNLSDYQWHFEPIHSRAGICCNGIGLKIGSFLSNTTQEKFTYDFKELDQTAEKILGLIVGDLCLVNAHFPMAESGRMTMASNFDKCLPHDKNYKLIIAGDFNSFPDCKGPEQIDTIQKVTGTFRISDKAISESNGNIATHSFKPYPYDIVPEESLKLPGKLDHIFVKGIEIADQMLPLVIDARTVKGQDFAPSDHYPITSAMNIGKI